MGPNSASWGAARSLGPQANGPFSAAYALTTLTASLVNQGMLRKTGEWSDTRAMSGLVIANKLLPGGWNGWQPRPHRPSLGYAC